MPLNLLSTANVTNINSMFYSPDDRLTNLGLTLLAPEVGAGSLVPFAPNAKSLNLGTVPGQGLQGNHLIGEINFVGTASRSTFIPLLVDNITALRDTGVPIPRALAGTGRVVVVGNEPLLEAIMTTNHQRLLVLYGEPGNGYVVQTSTSLEVPMQWQTAWQGSLTNLSLTIQAPGNTNGSIYYRAYRQ